MFTQKSIGRSNPRNIHVPYFSSASYAKTFVSGSPLYCALLIGVFAWELIVIRFASNNGERFKSPRRTLSFDWFAFFFYFRKPLLLKSCILRIPQAGYPKLYAFNIEVHSQRRATDGVPVRINSYARAVDSCYDSAVTKATGELLERIPYFYYKESMLTKLSIEQCRNSHQFMGKISDSNHFYAQNGQEVHIDENTYLNWVKGFDLKGDITLIPAASVFSNFNTKAGQLSLFEQELSTHGTGSHTTPEKALSHALCEWAERDGFFHHWTLDKQGKSVDLDDLMKHNEEVKEFITIIRESGYDVRVCDVTSPKVPVPAFFASVYRTSSKAAMYQCSGGGCNADWQDAVLASIKEACGGLLWVDEFYEDRNERKKISQQEYDTQQRVSHFAEEENYGKVLSFFSHDVRSASYFDEKYSKVMSAQEVFVKADGVKVGYVMNSKGVLSKIGSFSCKVYCEGLVPPYQNMKYQPRIKILQRAKEFSVDEINWGIHPLI